MNSAEYGSSDIIWKKIDPKTFELTNKPPMEPPGLPPMPAMRAMSEMDKIREMTGKQMTQSELENMQKGMGMRELKRPDFTIKPGDYIKNRMEMDKQLREVLPQERPTGTEGKEWKHYMDAIVKGLKYTDGFPMGLRDLFERGEVWIDVNGDIRSLYPLRGRERRKLVGAINGLSGSDKDLLYNVQDRTAGRDQGDMGQQ